MIWVEIHCDKCIEGRSKSDPLLHRCYSHNNFTPGEMISPQNLTKNYRAFAKYAIDKLKWKYDKELNQWTCPGCQNE